MTPSSRPQNASLSGVLVLVLVILLVAGAAIVRLAGDDLSSLFTGAATGADASVPQPQEGRLAPDFTLPDLDGQAVSLSQWHGRPVLINFWATWCGPCAIEMPTIQKAYEAHQQDGFVVLAVAVDDTVTNVQSFFDEYDLTFQVLIDDGTAARAYQVFGLPTSFFVSADGAITTQHTGLLTADKLEQYLSAAMSD